MPVEDDINLDKPLTEEDFQKMEEEAKRLAKIADEARDDAKDAKDLLKAEEDAVIQHAKLVEQLEKQRQKAEKEKLKIGRTVREVNELSESRSPLQDVGGEGEFVTDRMLQASPDESGFGGRDPFSGRIKRGRREGQSQEQSATGNMEKMKESFIEAEKLMAKRKLEVDKSFALASKKHAELVKKVSGVENNIRQAVSMSANPVGFMRSKILGIVGKAGIAGMVAVFGYEVMTQIKDQIVQEIKALFAPGGSFDIRKTVLDNVSTIANFDHVVKVAQGQVYFTSDTAEDIRQGVPQNANTRRLVNGHKQFVQVRDF